MPAERKTDLDIREMIRRLRLREATRAIARDLGVSRNTVSKYRQWADREGFLESPTLPDLQTIKERFDALEPPSAFGPPSSVEPYRALVGGQPYPLPAGPLSYLDVAAWQAKRPEGDGLAKQLAYWTQNLGDNPAELKLPADRPRPALQTFRGAHLPVNLSGELTESLRSLSDPLSTGKKDLAINVSKRISELSEMLNKVVAESRQPTPVQD